MCRGQGQKCNVPGMVTGKVLARLAMDEVIDD